MPAPWCAPCAHRHRVDECPCAQHDPRHPERPDTYSHVCAREDDELVYDYVWRAYVFVAAD